MVFYSPEKPTKQRNWVNIPETPIIPSILADAANYTLDSFTPLPLSIPNTIPNFSIDSSSPIGPSASPPLLDSPFHDFLMQNLHIKDPSTHHLRPLAQTPFDKVDDVLQLCSDKFGSLSKFLDVLFENISCDTKDPHTTLHLSTVAAFLSGQSTIKAVHIVKKMYRHHASIPNHHSQHKEELHSTFDQTIDPHSLHYARPAISIWALKLVGDYSHMISQITLNFGSVLLLTQMASQKTNTNLLPGMTCGHLAYMKTLCILVIGQRPAGILWNACCYAERWHCCCSKTSAASIYE